MDKITVSHHMAEALQEQFPANFKEGVFDNQYKIFGEICSIKSTKDIHEHMEMRIGRFCITHKDVVEIGKEVEMVAKTVAQNAINNKPTFIQWVSA